MADVPQAALQLIRGSLRTKFILLIVTLEIVLMGAVTFVVEEHQRRAILDQARLRALSMGTSLAALTEGYLLSYNFVQLEQAAESLTAGEEDVVYTVAHLRNGKVAAFSGRSDLQGKTLEDLVSQAAVAAEAPLVQTIIIPQTKRPGYDVAVPVYAPGGTQKWGTIRLGFSLKRAYEAIDDTRRDLLVLGGIAIVCGTCLAILLSRRISKPIASLVSEVHEIARGSYDHAVRVNATDEIGYLAQAFEQMRISLQGHLRGLAQEKQRLEETNSRLKDTQEQLIQLSARVAHEVNNPLAIIKTAMRIIKKQSKEDDLAKENLEVVEEEINRIARIIREILAFSRPHQTDEIVQVNTTIENLAGLLTQNLQEKQITLQVILEPELPPVWISSDHLKQVFLNIVRNAEDAMPNGGHLLIQTSRGSQGVVLSITDTGCGIAKEYLNRLFDPFFTTKDKDNERGMGLGLAVSSGIVRRANGNIEVESEIGKGSTFRVSLPAHEAKSNPLGGSVGVQGVSVHG